jgi:hypothetical protein
MRKFTGGKTATILTGIAVMLTIAAVACGTEPEAAARDSGESAGDLRGIAVGEPHLGSASDKMSDSSLSAQAPCDSEEVAATASAVEPVMPVDGATGPDGAATVDPEVLIDRTEIEAGDEEEGLAGGPCAIDGPLMEMQVVPTGEDGQASDLEDLVVNGDGSDGCSAEVASTTETLAPSVDDTAPAGTLTPEELEKLIDRTEVEVNSAERDDEPATLCVGGDAVSSMPVDETTAEAIVEAAEEK